MSAQQKVCTGCRQRQKIDNFWTETVCKYCAQKAGRTIYAYEQRNTTQYRKQY